MPYARMLRTLHGRPLSTNGFGNLSNFEPVKEYSEKKVYNLPDNLYRLWKRDIIPATPQSKANNIRLKRSAEHTRKINR